MKINKINFGEKEYHVCEYSFFVNFCEEQIQKLCHNFLWYVLYI